MGSSLFIWGLVGFVFVGGDLSEFDLFGGNVLDWVICLIRSN